MQTYFGFLLLEDDLKGSVLLLEIILASVLKGITKQLFTGI